MLTTFAKRSAIAAQIIFPSALPVKLRSANGAFINFLLRSCVGITIAHCVDDRWVDVYCRGGEAQRAAENILDKKQGMFYRVIKYEGAYK